MAFFNIHFSSTVRSRAILAISARRSIFLGVPQRRRLVGHIVYEATQDKYIGKEGIDLNIYCLAVVRGKDGG